MKQRAKIILQKHQYEFFQPKVEGTGTGTIRHVLFTNLLFIGKAQNGLLCLADF